MNILITNDDGVHGAGLIWLARALCKDHHVTVVAPDRERSGMSHALTLDRPLQVREEAILDGVKAFAVDGTPVDCVRLGLGALCDEPADLLLAGINHGGNLGGDISYSGTVHAALEGSVCGVPSVALSVRMWHGAKPAERDRTFQLAAHYSAQFVGHVDLLALDGFIYNVNFPHDLTAEPPEIKVCPQGESAYETVYSRQDNAFGRSFYWIGANPAEGEYNREHRTDVYWAGMGYATLTPLRWNLTALDKMEETTSWLSNVVLRGMDSEAQGL